MNNQQFIAKQRAKYYWKALRQTASWRTPDFRTSESDLSEAFWEYEQTPRVTV